MGTGGGPAIITAEQLARSTQKRLAALERRPGRNGIVPGSVTLYAGATAPAGYMICDGSAISRAAYPALFAAIGTAYGAGDGSTTFNIPNLKGRIPVGRDAAQTEFDVLGETGGAKTHAHTLSDSAQAQIAVVAATPAIVTRRVAATSWTPTQQITTALSVGGAAAAQTVAAALQGSTDSASTLQPYVVMNYVISI